MKHTTEKVSLYKKIKKAAVRQLFYYPQEQGAKATGFNPLLYDIYLF